MKSSAGSDAFALLALAAIVLFVLLLLRHFLPIRTTPAYLTVPVFLALALPLSIFLLVPIDLASSSRNSEDNARSIWLPDGVILVVWRLAYWLTFALTWSVVESVVPHKNEQLTERVTQVHPPSTRRICRLGIPLTSRSNSSFAAI